MKMKTVFALVAAGLLYGMAPAAGDSDLSSNPTIERARVLVVAGSFDAALAVLRPLERDGPNRIDVLFLTGLAAIGASRRPELPEGERARLLDEAIAALRAILIDRPGLVRVRLELARAFFLKGEDDLSRGHFERVLAGRPLPAVAANINRFLAAMRARKRWTGYVGAALAPDSNIGAASEADIIYIHGLPFNRGADAGTKSGVGLTVWGGSEYQYPLSERLRLRAGADAARREHAGRAFDQTFAAVHLGPRWLLDANSEASLLATARRNWIAEKPQDHALGGRLEVKRRLTRRLTAHGRASWESRVFRSRKHLNGPLVAASAGGTWVVSPTVRFDAVAGYGRERPRAEVWRNTTLWARTDVSVALPLGFTLGGGGEVRATRYRGRWFPFTPDGASRRDRTRILRATALNRSLTVLGFSPQLVLVNEARFSNAQLYDYRRNRAELRLQRLF